MCTRFHLNRMETVEAVPTTWFWQKCGCHGTTLSAEKKKRSCMYSLQDHHIYQVSFKLHQNCRSSSTRKDFVIKCGYQSNALSDKVEKHVLRISTPYIHTYIHTYIHVYITGAYTRWWPKKNGTVDTVDFSGLCSDQVIIFQPCWIEHLFVGQSRKTCLAHLHPIHTYIHTRC